MGASPAPVGRVIGSSDLARGVVVELRLDVRTHLGAPKRALEALNLVLIANVFLQRNTPMAGDFHPLVHGMVKIREKLHDDGLVQF